MCHCCHQESWRMMPLWICHPSMMTLMGGRNSSAGSNCCGAFKTNNVSCLCFLTPLALVHKCLSSVKILKVRCMIPISNTNKGILQGSIEASYQLHFVVGKGVGARDIENWSCLAFCCLCWCLVVQDCQTEEKGLMMRLVVVESYRVQGMFELTRKGWVEST